MKRVRYIEAWTAALRDELREDPDTFLLGEDIRDSLRRGTVGLHQEFGDARIIDAPLSEQAFTGFATGAAIAGKRPIIEYEIPTLIYVAFDQLVNQAAKFRLMTGGQAAVPVTYLVPGSGSRRGLAGQHSDHPYALLAQAGVKTAVPSTPSDAYGLIRTAIRDNDPVVVFGPATSMGVREELDLSELPLIPLGEARTHREGSDVTVVAVGHLVQIAGKVADALAPEISIEVIDPRTVYPFDWEALRRSLDKTGRLVVFDDTNRTCGLAGEIIATAVEGMRLSARPVRVTRADIAVPFSPVIESRVLPQAADLRAAIMKVMQKEQQW